MLFRKIKLPPEWNAENAMGRFAASSGSGRNIGTGQSEISAPGIAPKRFFSYLYVRIQELPE